MTTPPTPPSALTREQQSLERVIAKAGGMLDSVLTEENAALRATIDQQAQEVERLTKEISASQAVTKTYYGDEWNEIKSLKQQLAAMTAERDEAVTLYSLEAEKERKLSIEFGKQNFELTVTRQQLATLQATLAERDAYKAVLQGAEYEQVDKIGTLSVEVAQRIGVTAAHRTKEIVAQLAASQARVRELEDEIVKHRPKSECYDRICQSLGISHNILGHLATLQATLAEREELVEGLKTELEEYRSLAEKLGAEKAISERDIARQNAARLREALEAVLPIAVEWCSPEEATEVAAIEQAQAALKGA